MMNTSQLDKLDLNTFGVQEMSEQETIKITGGKKANSNQEKIMAWAGAIFGIGSCFGPVGLALCGPTALGLATVSVYLAYNKERFKIT